MKDSGMSEPQTPSNPNHPNTQETPHAGHGDAQAEPVRPNKIPRAKPLPDWKPLGSIRDYFTEQMRQDSIYRS